METNNLEALEPINKMYRENMLKIFYLVFFLNYRLFSQSKCLGSAL